MKKRLIGGLIASLFFSLLLSGCQEKKSEAPAEKTVATPAAPVELTVSAAISMKDALAEIQKNYEAKHPDIKLLFNLGASGSLQKQIEQGAPADIFISAATKQMDELESKNLLVKDSRKNLLENQLVLITAKNSVLDLNSYEALAGDKVKKLSIGEPTVVPAGQYAMEVFKKLSLWDKIKDKAVLAKDVRTVLSYVETGNVEAGVVYKSDTVASDKVKVVASAPKGSHKPIVYPMAILANSKQQKAAADFTAFLTAPDSKAIFEKYGFTMSK